MSDLFHGEPLPEKRPADFDLMAWLGEHSVERVEPVVNAAIKHLRETKGVTRLGAVGHCFGAKYVVRGMAKGGGIDVGYVAHPSFVDEEELQKLAGPLSIAAAGEWSL
jgi:dienelactone hydrolase